MLELDKKFIQKIILRGGVERDVFVKRYETYVWSIINKKVSTDRFPEFIKKDIFQYVFIKIFENEGRVLKQYLEEYSIPFQNFLSIFTASRILDYIRKEIKESEREVVILSDEGENLAYENTSSEAPSAIELIESIDFLKILETYETKLLEKERPIFRLMCEGLSSGDIAKELNYDVKHVYKIVFKIKHDLKKTTLKDVA